MEKYETALTKTQPNKNSIRFRNKNYNKLPFCVTSKIAIKITKASMLDKN